MADLDTWMAEHGKTKNKWGNYSNADMAEYTKATGEETSNEVANTRATKKPGLIQRVKDFVKKNTASGEELEKQLGETARPMIGTSAAGPTPEQKKEVTAETITSAVKPTPKAQPVSVKKEPEEENPEEETTTETPTTEEKQEVEETTEEQDFQESAKEVGIDPTGEAPTKEEAKSTVQTNINDLVDAGILTVNRDKNGKVVSFSFPGIQSSTKGKIARILTGISVAATILTGLPPVNFVKLTGADADAEAQKEAYTTALNSILRPIYEEAGQGGVDVLKGKEGKKEAAEAAAETDIAREGVQARTDIAKDADIDAYTKKSDLDLQRDLSLIDQNYQNDLAKMDAAHRNEMEALHEKFVQELRAMREKGDIDTEGQKELAGYLANIKANELPAALKAVEDAGYNMHDVAVWARSNQGDTTADRFIKNFSSVVGTITNAVK